MSRILVTGASGFVGGHLRGALREAFPDATLLAATRGEAVPGWDEAVTQAGHNAMLAFGVESQAAAAT